MDPKLRTLDAGPRRDGREMLEGADELRPAVRVARVIERVHADDEVVSAEDLRPAEGEREEDRVPRGDVGRWNLRGLIGGGKIAIARDGFLRRQRRSANGAQVDADFLMLLD